MNKAEIARVMREQPDGNLFAVNCRHDRDSGVNVLAVGSMMQRSVLGRKMFVNS